MAGGSARDVSGTIRRHTISGATLAEEDAAAGRRLIGPVLFRRLSWDGRLDVSGLLADSRGAAPAEAHLLSGTLHGIADAEAFIDRLTRLSATAPRA
jgi:hypothetical protein